MAMFPNAAHGVMPFVNGANGKHKRSKTHVNGGKLHKVSENRKQTTFSQTQKIYQVTLRDRKGHTYKCLVKADGTLSLPDLTQSNIVPKLVHKSLPDLTAMNSPSKQRRILDEKLQALNSSLEDESENFSTSLDLRDCGKKEGIFGSILRFIKQKTSSSKSAEKKPKDSTKSSSKSSSKSTGGKSKRKPKDLEQRKRQRTVSAMSNLDPIEESPNEAEYEDIPDDNDSYSHFSSGYPSDSDSLSSQISCNIIAIEAQS